MVDTGNPRLLGVNGGHRCDREDEPVLLRSVLADEIVKILRIEGEKVEREKRGTTLTGGDSVPIEASRRLPDQR